MWISLYLIHIPIGCGTSLHFLVAFSTTIPFQNWFSERVQFQKESHDKYSDSASPMASFFQFLTTAEIYIGIACEISYLTLLPHPQWAISSRPRGGLETETTSWQAEATRPLQSRLIRYTYRRFTEFHPIFASSISLRSTNVYSIHLPSAKSYILLSPLSVSLYLVSLLAIRVRRSLLLNTKSRYGIHLELLFSCTSTTPHMQQSSALVEDRGLSRAGGAYSDSTTKLSPH
jgi:hypothetical protein